MMELRQYQSQAIDELWEWFSKHPLENPIMDCCVGSGKSLMIAATLQRAIREYPGTRVIVIAHQKELIQQNLDKLRAIWPDADVGVYSAALGRKDTGRKITYATIGSIYKDAHLMGAVSLVLCDECHLINSKEIGMWRKFINDMRSYGNKNMCVIGWTGTPFRNGGIWLTADEQSLFSGIAARITMTDMLAQKYLCPLTPISTSFKIETEGVRTALGDYVVSDLAKATDTHELVESACDEICRLAQDRKRWLVFCVNVEHANHVNDALIRRGIASGIVTGETPQAQREILLRDYANDRLRALCSIGVLTTGFDQPDIDFIALLRATKSPTLAIQMCGRGMRTAPGKVDCAFADFTTTISDLGPIDLIKGRMPKEGKGEAPFKLCPECGSRNTASASHCIDCGHEFPPPVHIKHGKAAITAPVLSTQLQPAPIVWHDVSRVDYSVHRKEGKPDSLRVDYWSGMMVVGSEWICFEHSGYARQKAEQWWRTRSIKALADVPDDTGTAWVSIDMQNLHERNFKEPTRIATRKNGKYTEVVNYEFSRTESHERGTQKELA